MQSLRRFVLNSVSRRGYKQLSFTKHGAPLEVLSMNEAPKLQWKPGMTEIKVLMANINPADINIIEGVYPFRPDLTKGPGVTGMDCVGEVVRSDRFKKGDRVYTTEALWGTWREGGLVRDNFLYKVPENMSNLEIVTSFGINPCAAYLMLTDYVKLNRGDTVIQNAATNAVALFVMQLCKVWGLKTVNTIRQFPDQEKVKQHLYSYGADIVVTEDEFAQGWKKLFNKDLPRPRVALNCVAGKSAADLCKALADGGTLVTFGGLSRQPTQLPTTAHVFRDVRARGFLLSIWRKVNEDKYPQISDAMLDDISSVLAKKKFKMPDVKVYPFSQWEAAVKHAQHGTAGFSSTKIIFNMEE